MDKNTGKRRRKKASTRQLSTMRRAGQQHHSAHPLPLHSTLNKNTQKLKRKITQSNPYNCSHFSTKPMRMMTKYPVEGSLTAVLTTITFFMTNLITLMAAQPLG